MTYRVDDDGQPVGLSGLRQLSGWEGEDLRTAAVRNVAIEALRYISELEAKLERECEWRRAAIRIARAVAIEDAAKAVENDKPQMLHSGGYFADLIRALASPRKEPDSD